MTTVGWNYLNATPTVSQHPNNKNFAGLPQPQNERLKRSFDSLPGEDASDELRPRDIGQNAMDTDMAIPLDMIDPPDYDGWDSHDDQSAPASYLTGDLATLPRLTEDTVQEVIKARYRNNQIYTACSDVLISVNPFKQLPIFDEKSHEAYGLDHTSPGQEEPHVFRTARDAVERRAKTDNDQVILVSGESGAGKTEAVKYMLRHILHLCASHQDKIYDSIDQVNPLLELFGNARTSLNDNSSRFAKFLSVQFQKGPRGQVTGAHIRDYILEKSRVVNPGEHESNFHIFYTFLHDVMADPQKQSQFLMQGMDVMSDFKIVPRKSWHRSGNRMSSKDQARVFRQIGMQQEEVDNMHTILAAILHLTNIRFVDEDGSTGGVTVDNEDTMVKAAALLSVEPEKLAQVLVSTTMTYSGEEILTFKSNAKACETRDAIAKALYERLFGWLIRSVNTSLANSSGGASIGFLDICGFEDLQHNSLEQLCINMANEHLQRFMNQEVFVKELDYYKHEGVELSSRIEAPSNQQIIDMFIKPRTGILALINEDTKLDISSDKSMVQKLANIHGKSPHFLRYKNEEPRFGIKHYAAPVWYSARDFLEKNGDALGKEAKEALLDSHNELISDIFRVTKAPTGSIAPTNFNYRSSQRPDIHFNMPGKMNLTKTIVRGLGESLRERFGRDIPKPAGKSTSSQSTAVDYFQASMTELLNQMRSAQRLFVRCIKPNDRQEPDRFDEGKVGLQLRYNGVSEIARIRRLGFPVRISFDDFLKSFCCLCERSKQVADKAMAIRIILQQCGGQEDSFTLGKSKVLLKQDIAQKLEQQKAELERENAAKLAALNAAKNAAAARNLSPLSANLLSPLIEVPTPAPTPNRTPQGSTSQSTATLAPEPPKDEQTVTKTVSSPSQPTETPAPSSVPENNAKDFWDIFRIVAREQPASDIHHKTAMRILKLIVYVFIFLTVLGTATAQKVSLIFMATATAAPADKMKSQNQYYILLVIAMCIPNILAFIVSFFKVAFGGFSNPSLVTWIWAMLTECLHTFGLSLLVFRILPRLDVVYGLLFLSAVAAVPSLLKLVTSAEPGRSSLSPAKRYCLTTVDGVLDFLALAGQMSVFPMVYVLDYVSTSQDGVLSVLDVTGAVVCVSVANWENFCDGRFFMELGDMNPFKNFLLKRRFELQRGRYIPQLFNSVLKVGLLIGLAYFFKGGKPSEIDDAFSALTSPKEHWCAIAAILVLTLSAAVCYYMSYIACKLWMQRISFSIPIVLSTPAALIVFYLDHEYNFLRSVSSTCDPDKRELWKEINWSSDWPWLAGGVAWWLSLLFLTRHIWFPRQARLAKIEMLFMNPVYCGILTAENLLLNRRRHTLSIRKNRDGAGFYYSLTHHERKSNTEYNGAAAVDDSDQTYADIAETEGMASNQTLGTNNPGGDTAPQPNVGDEDIPMIYACATMWHEIRREMVALLKSLHRIDREQFIRKQAQEMSKTRDKDYFKYEAHIFFDDAMTLDDDEDYVPNSYVKMLVEVMEEAVSSIYKKVMVVQPPIKIATPYGGQLLWEMPGGNLLFVHLKDKAKIRHRKRWSQVMYMYYLLGFRLTRHCQEQILQALQNNVSGGYSQWNVNRPNDTFVGSDIFDMLSESVALKSHNTYVMALDGDTDFYPGSVHILLDRMKKNPKVGAACGRIHPIGSGPLVWYQMFEYAIGHWMQKATEHVLGCVLCSPGCFSLFRGSALMDDNVMRMYTILPTEPGHFLQYDQGEDRWLCTLLLQQGYRVDYAAAADAWTYAPEGFNEFFNQRRRWMPSTLANVMDLLADYKNTVTVNSNISMLYIAYQVALMISTLIGPGTVLMMISGAIREVFELELIWAYVVALVPAVAYVFICFYCKPNTQLYVAAILSTFYVFVMMIVFVGTIIIAVKESFFHPSVLVIIILIMIFVFAGFCHPMELYCLPPGALYLLCVPSGYLLLVIYSLCNLHVVSWGTREVAQKKTKAQELEEAEEKKKKEEEAAKKKGFFSRFFFSPYMNDLKELISSAIGSKPNQIQGTDRTVQLLEEINENIKKLNADAAKKAGSALEALQQTSTPSSGKTALAEVHVDPKEEPKEKKKKKGIVRIAESPAETIPEPKPVRDDMVNPKWIEDPGLGNGRVAEMFSEELKFWKDFIGRYLKPLDADKKKEAEMAKNLLELRTNVVFGVSMINLLWIAINFMFQYKVPIKIHIPVDPPVDVDILGMLFVLFLLAVLFLQIIGMIIHRWGTLLHLLAFTDLDVPCCKKKIDAEGKPTDFKRAFEFCKAIIEEPMPDYMDDSPANADVDPTESISQRLRETILGVPSLPSHSVVGSLNTAGVIPSGPEFLRRPGVDAYLRGIHSRDPDDADAREFVDSLRFNIGQSYRPQYLSNGGHGMSRDRGVSSRRGPRGDSHGLAPAVPRRQNSAIGGAGAGGVRRRLPPSHLGQTARDIIDRARGQGISVAPTPRRYGEDEFAAQARRRGEAHPPSAMDREFSRRMRFFNDFSNTQFGGGVGGGSGGGGGMRDHRRTHDPRHRRSRFHDRGTEVV